MALLMRQIIPLLLVSLVSISATGAENTSKPCPPAVKSTKGSKSKVPIPPPQAPSTTTNSVSKQAKPPADSDAAKALHKEVELPGVPGYTGNAKFIDGYLYPNLAGKPAVSLRYSAHEEPADILDWYKNSLKVFSWTVSNTQPNSRSISATLKGNSCSVTVVNPSTKDARCDFEITYTWAQKTQ